MATFTGTPNADSIVGTQTNDTISGLAGNDTLIGAAGSDSVLGGDGNDRLYGDDGNDTLRGELGNDSLWGGAGSDLLHGGPGSDRFFPSAGDGSDTIVGDYMTTQRWPSFLEVPDGTSDYDFLIYTDDEDGIIVDLAKRTVVQKNGLGFVDIYSGIEEIRGSPKSDLFTGRQSEGNSLSLSGHGGSDVITQTTFGVPGRWTDGLSVSYWWSQTAINMIANGNVVTVSYGAGDGSKGESSAYLAGSDTLTNITLFVTSDFDDFIDFRLASTNHLGYATNTADRISYHIIFVRAGNDTIAGNGNTLLWNTAISDSTKLLDGRKQGLTFDGASIDGQGFSTLDLRHLLSGSLAYGQVKYSGVSYALGTNFDDVFRAGGPDLRSFRGLGGNDLIYGNEYVNLASYRGGANPVTFNVALGLVSDTGSGTSVGSDTVRSVESFEGTAFSDYFDASGFSKSSTNPGSWGWQGLSNWFEPSGGFDTVIGNGQTRLVYEKAMLAVVADLGAGYVDALDPAERQTSSKEYLYTVGRTAIVQGVSGVGGSDFGDSLVGGGVGGRFGTLTGEGFEGRAGNDTIDGRDGYDIAFYTSSPSGIRVDLTRTLGQVIDDGWGYTDTLLNIEEIQGSNYDDSIRGSSADDQVRPGKGKDTVDGGAGYDEVSFTQAGPDLDTKGVIADLGGVGATARTTAIANLKPLLPPGYTGWAVDNWGDVDVLLDIEGLEGSWYSDVLIGSDGSNRIDGRQGNDTLDGAGGVDWLELNNAETGVVVNLLTGLVSNDGLGGRDTVFNFENVQGGIYDDSILGNALNNYLQGEPGNDTLGGGEGDDTLCGGEGNDVLLGGNGYDVAVYSGLKSSYAYTKQSDGSYVVSSTPSATSEGVDRVVDIERLQFSDGFVDLVPPKIGSLSGMAYHWKSHALLSGISVKINDPGAIDPSNAVFDLRAASFDSATSTLTVQIWTTTSNAASVDFLMQTKGATTASFTPAQSISNWTTITNTINANEVSIGGFKSNPNEPSLSGTVQLGTLKVVFGSVTPSIQVGFSDIFIGTVSAPVTTISLASQVTGPDGRYEFSGLSDGNYQLDVSRKLGDGSTNSGITSADALAALNIAVGLNPNPDPDGMGPLSPLKVSPYQIIAADVNGDGRVTSADAYGILEMAVRLPTAAQSAWVLLDERRDLSKITRTNALVSKEISVTLPAQAETNLVGLLKGDVNGSWNLAGAQTVDQLQPGYFSRLATLVGVSSDQWGVSPQSPPPGD